MGDHTGTTGPIDDQEVLSNPNIERCHNIGATSLEKDRPTPPGPDGDRCNIYYVHQGGLIFHQASIKFQGIGSENETYEVKCGKDRLTLVHLPTSSGRAFDSEKTEASDTRLKPPEFTDIPPYFKTKMFNICGHCRYKESIVWRGFQKPESHFDACFRYHDDLYGDAEPKRRCFLKFYSLKLPYLSQQQLTLSVVEHVRTENYQFVPTDGRNGANQEHIFAFISGLKSEDLGNLLTDLFSRWQEVLQDHHMKSSTGMTAMLFLGATIFQYGNIVKDRIIITYYDLIKCDDSLRKAVEKLKSKDKPDEIRDFTPEIESVISNLINMNIDLTGTRSTMHFLAESADYLAHRVSFFKDSVIGCLDDSRSRLRLKSEFLKLDCHKELTRDKDKLEMVKKTMDQYKADIEALKQHIDINVGMLQNVIAEKENVIQLGIMANTDRNGYEVKVISTLTILLLPATFMAIFLTTPMFSWDPEGESDGRQYSWKVYWIATISTTAFLIMGFIISSFPELSKNTINFLGGKHLRNVFYKSLVRWLDDLSIRDATKNKARRFASSSLPPSTCNSKTTGTTDVSKGATQNESPKKEQSDPTKGELENGAVILRKFSKPVKERQSSFFNKFSWIKSPFSSEGKLDGDKGILPK